MIWPGETLGLCSTYSIVIGALLWDCEVASHPFGTTQLVTVLSCNI